MFKMQKLNHFQSVCRSKSVHDVSSGSNDCTETDGACGNNQFVYDSKEYFINIVNRNAVRNISFSRPCIRFSHSRSQNPDKIQN